MNVCIVCHPNLLRTISLVLLVNIVKEHDSLQEKKIVFGKAKYNSMQNKIDSVFKCTTVKQFWTEVKKYH